LAAEKVVADKVETTGAEAKARGEANRPLGVRGAAAQAEAVAVSLEVSAAGAQAATEAATAAMEAPAEAAAAEG